MYVRKRYVHEQKKIFLKGIRNFPLSVFFVGKTFQLNKFFIIFFFYFFEEKVFFLGKLYILLIVLLFLLKRK